MKIILVKQSVGMYALDKGKMVCRKENPVVVREVEVEVEAEEKTREFDRYYAL